MQRDAVALAERVLAERQPVAERLPDALEAPASRQPTVVHSWKDIPLRRTPPAPVSCPPVGTGAERG